MKRSATRSIFHLATLLIVLSSPAAFACDNFQIAINTTAQTVTFSWTGPCLQYAWSFRGEHDIDCCGQVPPRTWSLNLNCMTGPEELVAQDASPYSGNPILGRIISHRRGGVTPAGPCKKCSPICSYNRIGNTFVQAPMDWKCDPPMPIVGYVNPNPVMPE